MKTSIVIVSHNEGPDLLTTVASAVCSDPAPHEIIVVDDCSTDPVEPRLTSFPGVRVLRTLEQLGAGPAKRYGVEASTGDVAIIMDAHMRMPLDWLTYVGDAVNNYPDSIFCTVCRGFDVAGTFLGSGAVFSRDNDLFLGRKWARRGNIDAVETIPCLLGAAYIVPRHIWNDLDGINPNFRGWGYGEQDLSIRAWMFGHEVRRINGLCIQHRFNRKNKSDNWMSSWHNGYNAYVTASTIFEDGVFERLYLPYFRRLYNIQAYDKFVENKADIMDFRDYVQTHRRYADDELHGLCGFRLPTPHEQNQKLDALLNKRRVKRKKPCECKGKCEGCNGVVSTKIPTVSEPPKPALGEAHRQRILDALPPGGRMLEWGCGGSTIWFRNNLEEGQTITSIEHDERWAKTVGGVVLQPFPFPVYPAGSPRNEFCEGTTLVNTATELPYVACEGLGTFDVILVDGVFRNACLLKAAELLNHGGSVFLHDSQRDWYSVGLKDWVTREEYPQCPDYPGPSLLELVPRRHAVLKGSTEI